MVGLSVFLQFNLVHHGKEMIPRTLQQQLRDDLNTTTKKGVEKSLYLIMIVMWFTG